MGELGAAPCTPSLGKAERFVAPNGDNFGALQSDRCKVTYRKLLSVPDVCCVAGGNHRVWSVVDCARTVQHPCARLPMAAVWRRCRPGFRMVLAAPDAARCGSIWANPAVQSMVDAPSTTKLLPTANDERSESNHITASATSRGWPRRPIG